MSHRSSMHDPGERRARHRRGAPTVGQLTEMLSILVVRLGAMGDILHTLPAVASLKLAFPESRVAWLVETKWAPLLEGNPSLDRIAILRRDALFASWRELRRER